MGGLCQKILQFVKDISADTKKNRKGMQNKLPLENISKPVLSSVGLALFSFSVSMLYGHWRQLCTMDITAVTKEKGKIVLHQSLKMAPSQCPEKWQTCHS